MAATDRRRQKWATDIRQLFLIAAAAMAGEWQHHQAATADINDIHADNLNFALGSDGAGDNLQELAFGSDGGGDNLELAFGSDGSFELLWPEDQPDDADDDANNTATATSTAAAVAAAEEEEEDNRGAAKGFKRKRHSREQIRQLEAAYQECTNPDKNQRKDLSERLGLTLTQVKFWFQNRRAANKSQNRREKMKVASDENMALRGENESMREAITRKLCITCGGPTVAKPKQTPELLRLRAENDRLKDQLHRASAHLAMVSSAAAAGGAPPPAPHGYGYGYGGGGLPFCNLSYAAAVASPPPPPHRGA